MATGRVQGRFLYARTWPAAPPSLPKHALFNKRIFFRPLNPPCRALASPILSCSAQNHEHKPLHKYKTRNQKCKFQIYDFPFQNHKHKHKYKHRNHKHKNLRFKIFPFKITNTNPNPNTNTNIEFTNTKILDLWISLSKLQTQILTQIQTQK